MRKILLCILLCFFLFLLPSMTVGINIYQKSEGNPADEEWTYLRGVITRHRHLHFNGDDYVIFRAIFVHYTTHWFGNTQSGVFRHLEQIILPKLHIGFLGNHLVFAKFNMALNG